MPKLSIKHMNKIYDHNIQAVYDFNLDVNEGEFIVLVGPSGCGKTTVLRMIAGLESVDEGELYINGRLMNNVQPKNRNVSMVFQSYALYPYMSVYDNITFGLKYNKLSKEKITKKVSEIARLLDIENILYRQAGLLSGGQQQRVSIGRAMIRNADILLMDEPLSNLDAKLRFQMRAEIKRIHKNMKTTMIYVTHDQIEAMAMADRVVVMNEGKIQQIGTPIEIYRHPENMFVASFIGTPSINFIEGLIECGNFIHGKNKIELNSVYKDKLKEYEGEKVTLGIRPEDFGIVKNNEEDQLLTIDLRVDYKEYLGDEIIINGNWGNQFLKIKINSNTKLENEQLVHLQINQKNILFFENTTQKLIMRGDD